MKCITKIFWRGSQCLLLGIILLTGFALPLSRAQGNGSGSSGTPPKMDPLMLESLALAAKGRTLLEAGKIEEAIVILKKAYEIYPLHADTSCPPLAEAYVRKGQLREAEKTYRLAFAWRNDPQKLHIGSVDEITYARYALLEIRLQNWQEAFLAYEIARKAMSVEEQRVNMPVFDNHFQKKELEAAVRMILLDTIPYTKNDECIAEVQKILDLSPKFALAHYELADKLLRGRFESDRAAYRKAATPHYEAAVKYGNDDLQKRAQERLQDFRNEE